MDDVFDIDFFVKFLKHETKKLNDITNIIYKVNNGLIFLKDQQYGQLLIKQKEQYSVVKNLINCIKCSKI